MLLSELEFGSFLSYSVRGTDRDALDSQLWMLRLKDERHVGHPPEPMSIVVARRLAAQIDELHLRPCFSGSALLVPVPSSQVSKPATLWVPLLLARALVAAALARACEPCLRRSETVSKSATSPTKDRPTAQRHFESLVAGKLLFPPDEILLIDDVVTRGATLLGAASRLAEAFPGARISAFAAMRAISDPEEFKGLRDPCVGQIRLREDGSTQRRP